MYSPPLQPQPRSNSFRERLSEYSPLLSFSQYEYYDEQGQLVPHSPNSHNYHSQQSWAIYVKLYGLLAVCVICLVMGGLLVFRPINRSLYDNPDNLLPPIVFVPDLFCSDLEVRILHSNLTHLPSNQSAAASALSECPLFLSEYTSIYAPALLYDHSSCLIAALTMHYDATLNTWRNAPGVDVRVREEERRGIIVAEKGDEQQQRLHRSNKETVQVEDKEWQRWRRKQSAYTDAQEGDDDEGDNMVIDDEVIIDDSDVSDLSPTAPCNYALLVRYLHSMGYRDRHDLHTLPYDWRRSSASLLSPPSAFHQQITNMIESLHHRSTQRVLFIAHGAGTDHTLAFLRSHPMSWTQQHVDGLIALGGDMAGNLAYLPAILTGYYPRAQMFQHIPVAEMKKMYQSMEYFLWKLPLSYIYGQDYLVVQVQQQQQEQPDGVAKYYANSEDMISLLERSGAREMKQVHEQIINSVHQQLEQQAAQQQQQEVQQQQQQFSPSASSSTGNNDSKLLSITALTDPFSPPAVNTMCLYAAGVPSISHYVYEDDDLSQIPTVVYNADVGSTTYLALNTEDTNMPTTSEKTSELQSSQQHHEQQPQHTDELLPSSSHMNDRWQDANDLLQSLVITPTRSSTSQHKKKQQQKKHHHKSYTAHHHHHHDHTSSKSDIDNHAAFGRICQYWSDVRAAEEQQQQQNRKQPEEEQHPLNHTTRHSSSSSHPATPSDAASIPPRLLIASIPSTVSALPAKRRTIRAIHSIIGQDEM